MAYVAYWCLESGTEKIVQICSNHKNGNLLITNSWFVIAITVFYIVFYLAFRWCKGDLKKGIIYTNIGIGTYIIIAYIVGLGGWWFYSSFAFILGMIWKEKEKMINRVVEKKYVMFLLCWITIFGVGYTIRLFNSRTLQSPIIYAIALLISSAAFTGIIFTLMKKISINNRMWCFLGKISFEIYLLHELMYNILRSDNFGIYISSDLLYVVLVIFITVCFAYVFNELITKRFISRILGWDS